jgi:aminoglycoside phosphotransferase family enzyme
MNKDSIQFLTKTLGEAQFELIETHISWVLLGEKLAYKIKKPVQFDFLDFSSLENRKHFCERELLLNQRFSKGMYLAVLPITQEGESHFTISGSGTVVDYALQMRRMDSARQMDKCLLRKQVTPVQMAELAQEIATFHQQATIIYNPIPVETHIHEFSDILSIQSILAVHLGPAISRQLEAEVTKAQQYLKGAASHMVQRHQQGFVVDGHGDLHSRNIFMLSPPVLFDCIEFDDKMRQVDLLDELAFLCMDLRYHQQEELEAPFLKAYRKTREIFHTAADRALFTYYKWYRANVRLKVNLLGLSEKKAITANQQEAVKRLWQLFTHYGKLIP